MVHLHGRWVDSRAQLPPIACLIAFESVARHLSISRAADELSLTQSAISRQISKLEELAGVVLFRREKRRLSLTRAGSDYLHAARNALSAMMCVSELHARHRGDVGTVIRLAVQPTFARRWLLPRLAAFRTINPDFTIHVDCFLQLDNRDRHAYDAIIDFCRPDELYPINDVLIQPSFVAVCNINDYKKIEDINYGSNSKKFAFISSKTVPEILPLWLEQNSQYQVSSSKVVLFNEFSAAEEAAVNGLGIAILPRFLLEDNCKSGRLFILPSKPIVGDISYTFKCDANSLDRKPMKLFREWLIKEAALSVAHPFRLDSHST